MNIPPADSNANDLDILARTAWAEARGEGLVGMTAVVCTVLNRLAVAVKATAKNGKPYWWGGTVAEICLKHAQFSCWLHSDPNYAKLLAVTEDDKQFRDAVAIARNYLENGGPDITNGATHYCTRFVSPNWLKDMHVTAYIGDHVFYAPGPIAG